MAVVDLANAIDIGDSPETATSVTVIRRVAVMAVSDASAVVAASSVAVHSWVKTVVVSAFVALRGIPSDAVNDIDDVVASTLIVCVGRLGGVLAANAIG